MSFGLDSWLTAAGELGTCLVLAITGLVGYRKYRQERRKERLERDFEMRHSFIFNSQLSKIQSMVEHRSKALETVLEKLNSAENPYDPGILTTDEELIHQELDNYINFFECVGSLRSRKWLQEEDYFGFWSYYFHSLGKWKPLYRYLSDPRYEWYDVKKWVGVEEHLAS